MPEQKRVSGMTVGPFLSEDQHDAILKSRERRKQASQAGRAKSRGESISETPQTDGEQSGQSEQSQTSGY